MNPMQRLNESLGVQADEKADDGEPVRGPLFRGLSGRIHMSVRRRTPFLSEAAAKELAEDITENIAHYLKGVFDL